MAVHSRATYKKGRTNSTIERVEEGQYSTG